MWAEGEVSMKAIRVFEYGDPEVMQLETVSQLTPGPGQVLVDLKAVGVNPVDTYIRAGRHPSRKALPYTPGMDAAGIVMEVGQGCSGIQVNDRVFVSGSLSGTYASQALCLPEHVHRLPDGIDFAQGAALGVPYGTACRALFGRANVTAGQTVLIHGASGGVGIAAVQLALAGGLKVIATAGTEKGRQLLAEQGAQWVLDHHDPERWGAIMTVTEGRGVDAILEMLANINLDYDLDVVAQGGCVVVIGSRGRIEIDPRKTMARDLSIMGMMLMNTPPQDLKTIYAHITAGLEAGQFKPVVASQLLLKDASRAHREIMESGHHGKIVLIP